MCQTMDGKSVVTRQEEDAILNFNHYSPSYSISPNSVHICLHLAHHLDLHAVLIKHALGISDIKLYSNTFRNIHSIITFASLSSNVLQPVSPMITSFLTFSTSQSHLPIPFCLISKSSHSFCYHANAPQPYISFLTTIPVHPSQPTTY